MPKEKPKRIVPEEEVDAALARAVIPVERKVLSRFLSFTTHPITETGGCNLWLGAKRSKTEKGKQHGLLEVHGRNMRAHRYSYSTFVGQIPDRMHVLHNCPVDSDGQCVNPEHLKLGTHQENMKDRKDAGTTYKATGELHPFARLSEDDVLAIRAAYPGISQVELGRRYNVRNTTICAIIKRRNWKHI